MEKVNADEMAYKYNIQAKHLTEKIAAQECDVFTTVSKITAIETEKILSKKPDVVLENGLNMKSFPSYNELVLKRKKFLSKLKKFLMISFRITNLILTKRLFFLSQDAMNLEAKA